MAPRCHLPWSGGTSCLRRSGERPVPPGGASRCTWIGAARPLASTRTSRAREGIASIRRARTGRAPAGRSPCPGAPARLGPPRGETPGGPGRRSGACVDRARRAVGSGGGGHDRGSSWVRAYPRPGWPAGSGSSREFGDGRHSPVDSAPSVGRGRSSGMAEAQIEKVRVASGEEISDPQDPLPIAKRGRRRGRLNASELRASPHADSP
jgi:hypothetical protein